MAAGLAGLGVVRTAAAQTPASAARLPVFLSAAVAMGEVDGAALGRTLEAAVRAAPGLSLADQKSRSVVELLTFVWKHETDQSPFINYSAVLVLRADQGDMFMTNVVGARRELGLIAAEIVPALDRARTNLLQQGIWRPAA